MTRRAGAAKRSARRDFPLLAPPRISVSIAEESGPQFKKPRAPQCEIRKEKTSANHLRNQVARRTICFRPKHSALSTRGRSPDLQVIATPAGLPIPKNSGFTAPAARCSQWRDRAGFAPASLFTRLHDEHPRESSN